MADEYVVVSEQGMEYYTPIPRQHARAKAYSLNETDRRRDARAVPAGEAEV